VHSDQNYAAISGERRNTLRLERMASPAEGFFGIIGLDAEVVLAMKELPTQRVKGPALAFEHL
jgi:hypothetical protein